MGKSYLLISCAAFSIVGCANVNTPMRNAEGRAINCNAMGLGIIGSTAALAMHDNCISDARAKGFVPYDEALPTGGTASGGAAPPPAVSTSPITVSGKDGLFKITLPAGWTTTTPPNQSFHLAARNLSKETYLQISSVNASDVSDWILFTENLKTRLVGNLIQASASETQKIKINGFDALRADIGGTLKNGIKVHYLGTVLKTDKNLIYVLSWTTESNFSSARGDLEQLPFAMQF